MIDFMNFNSLEPNNGYQSSPKGIFYTVKSPDGKTVGYILGVTHVTNEHNRQLNDKINRCFEKSKYLAVECDPNNYSEILQKMETELLHRKVKLAVGNDSEIFSKIADSILSLTFDLGLLRRSDFIDKESDIDLLPEKMNEVITQLSSEIFQQTKFTSNFDLSGDYSEMDDANVTSIKDTNFSNSEANEMASKVKEFRIRRRNFILKTYLCLKMDFATPSDSLMSKVPKDNLSKKTNGNANNFKGDERSSVKVEKIRGDLNSAIIEEGYTHRNDRVNQQVQNNLLASKVYNQFNTSLRSWVMQQARVSSPGIDDMLIKKAQESSKKIIELENIEDADLKFSFEKLSDEIEPYSIKHITESIKITKQIAEEWTQGHLSEKTYKKCLAKVTPETFSRNEKMAKKINRFFLDAPEKRLFVAVGAAHLPYKNGIIDLLTQNGWVITQI